jgi:peroxiredoxin
MDLPTSPEIIIPENYLIMSTEEKQKLQQQWMETPAWKEYMKKMAESEHQAAEAFHESVIIESDGTVRAENIPPGDFCLSGSIGDPTVSRHSDQWYDSRIGTVKLFFTVPEVTEETDYEKPVDLGTIPIKLLKRMRVGEDFPAVELVGLDGHPIRLSDYHGCYVLIDFGFVMGSENPGESADLLKTLYTEFHKSRRFEILCVLPASRSSSQAMNDSYRKAILYFLKKKEIPWSVGMVSDEDVLQEFEPGGIYPSLVLVDPEGRIAALNIKPEELLETLRRHLLPKEHSMENPSPTP